jgi:hypothetical protein
MTTFRIGVFQVPSSAMTLPQYASKYKQSRFLPQRERKTQRKREEVEVDIMTVLADRDEGPGDLCRANSNKSKKGGLLHFLHSVILYNHRFILQKKKRTPHKVVVFPLKLENSK